MVPEQAFPFWAQAKDEEKIADLIVAQQADEAQKQFYDGHPPPMIMAFADLVE